MLLSPCNHMEHAAHQVGICYQEAALRALEFHINDDVRTGPFPGVKGRLNVWLQEQRQAEKHAGEMARKPQGARGGGVGGRGGE